MSISDADNPRAADIAVLLSRKASLQTSGALTPELEADIDAHLANLRTNLQDGAVPLGGKEVVPDSAQGAVAAEIKAGHRERSADVGSRALAALSALRDELVSAPAAESVATMRSCLAFCLGRIEHEIATAAARIR